MVEKPFKDYSLHAVGVYASNRMDAGKCRDMENYLTKEEEIEFSYVYPGYLARYLCRRDTAFDRAKRINTDTVSASEASDA